MTLTLKRTPLGLIVRGAKIDYLQMLSKCI
jgi:hypothetical protein